MRCLLLGFASGVGLLQTRAALPPLWLACLLLVAALFAMLLRARMRTAWARAAASLAGGALAGFLWAALVAGWTLSRDLPSGLEGQDLVVTGVIDSLPYRFDRSLRFNLAVEAAATLDNTAVRLPPRLALSWSRPAAAGAAAGRTLAAGAAPEAAAWQCEPGRFRL